MSINISEKKYIEIAPLGKVLFAKSRRPKRLSISIKRNGQIRVAVPAHISYKKAENFLLSNIDWAHKTITKVKKNLDHHKTTLSHNDKIDTTAAKTILINRLKELSKKFNLPYNKVTIRNQKTRWGSCSENNNISLNINLIKLKEELIDYVILHELAHTIVKNHSKTFWLELAKYIDRPKQYDKLLRKHQLGL